MVALSTSFAAIRRTSDDIHDLPRTKNFETLTARGLRPSARLQILSHPHFSQIDGSSILCQTVSCSLMGLKDFSFKLTRHEVTFTAISSTDLVTSQTLQGLRHPGRALLVRDPSSLQIVPCGQDECMSVHQGLTPLGLTGCRKAPPRERHVDDRDCNCQIASQSQAHQKKSIERL